MCPYDMYHIQRSIWYGPWLIWHELLLSQQNQLGHIIWLIFDMVHLAKMQNTSWKPSVKPKYFVHEIKKSGGTSNICTVWLSFTVVFGCILSVYSYYESYNIKLMVNWRILKVPLTTKFYSMVLSNGIRSWYN